MARSGRGPGYGALRFPVVIEGSLHLHEPDDRGDDQNRAREQPQTCPAGDGGLLPVLPVHLADLRGDYEGAHGADQNPDDQAEDSAQALTAVLLDLLVGLVRPVPAVEAKRDDEQEDPETDP